MSSIRSPDFFAKFNLAYDFPGRVDGVDSEVHERVGESFIEPQIIPPGHRHDVTEPLQSTAGARVT